MREPGISEIADRTAEKVLEAIKGFFVGGGSKKKSDNPWDNWLKNG